MENENRFKTVGKVKFVKGSILCPENGGLRFVLSVNNLTGQTTNPLLPIFDKKWKKVREDSKGWYANKTGAYKFGAINTTAVQSDVWIIHMLCQDGPPDKLKTDVKAIEGCLKNVLASAKSEKATVHVSNLLTNSIPELQGLLQKTLVENGVSVYYYEEV